MKLNEWLKQKRGRTTMLAKHFGLTLGAISTWRRSVPFSKMKEIERVTKGEVTLFEMLSEKMSKHE